MPNLDERKEKLEDEVVKQREKLDYYRQNRSEFMDDFLQNFENPKEPAVSGIIVVAPIAVTYLVMWWLLEKVNQIPGNQYFDITQHFWANQMLKLAILLFLGAVIVTGVGRFVRTRRGFKLEKMLDRLMDKIPFLGSVYNITKVTTDTVFGGAEEFREPVKLDFNGFRVTGFKTGNRADDGRDIVFVPTAPNITSGFVVEVAEEDYQTSDETVEDALTRVLSAGFGDSQNGDGSSHQDVEEE